MVGRHAQAFFNQVWGHRKHAGGYKEEILMVGAGLIAMPEKSGGLVKAELSLKSQSRTESQGLQRFVCPAGPG